MPTKYIIVIPESRLIILISTPLGYIRKKKQQQNNNINPNFTYILKKTNHVISYENISTDNFKTK